MMAFPKKSADGVSAKPLSTTGVRIISGLQQQNEPDDDEQQKSSRHSGVYQKLLNDSDYTTAFNRKNTGYCASYYLECLAAMSRNVSRRFGLILLFILAFFAIIALHGAFQLTQWSTTSKRGSPPPPTNNYFPRLAKIPLGPVETAAVIEYEKVVRGQLTCESVRDNFGQPTGNYTFVEHSLDETNVVVRTQPRRHPLIVHYIRMVPDYWYHDDGGKFNFSSERFVMELRWNLDRLQYLSILSAWKALLEAKKFETENNAEQADDDSEPVIYVHSNYEPRGKYYDLLTNGRSNVNFKWNYVPNFASLSGKYVDPIEHRADFQKVNATMNFGGVHSDFDVIWLNGTHMRELQNAGECFFSVDVNIRSQKPLATMHRKNFSYLLNAGIFGCQKQSKFLKFWLDSYYCDYRAGGENYLYNSGILVRILYEFYNQLVSPIALDWQSGMFWRPELMKELDEVNEKQLQSHEWLKFPSLHFYHIESYSFKWDFMLRQSTSILAQALRKAQFDTVDPQTSPLVDWD